jgi:hypothetical protein
MRLSPPTLASGIVDTLIPISILNFVIVAGPRQKENDAGSVWNLGLIRVVDGGIRKIEFH